MLANVVLHGLDTHLEASRWEFARYADDSVILLQSPDAEPKVRETVVHTLAGLGLRLNEGKTSFSHFLSARFLGFAFRRDSGGRAVRTVSPESLAEASETLLHFVHSAGNQPEAVATETARLLQSWLVYFYTPNDEPVLRELAQRIAAAWSERFAGVEVPDCLRWDSLCRGCRSRSRVDYSGHFQDAGSSAGWASSVDWTETARCLLWRLLRSRWWHLEYDLEWGRRPGVRLCVGRHRINLRF